MSIVGLSVPSLCGKNDRQQGANKGSGGRETEVRSQGNGVATGREVASPVAVAMQ